MTWDRRKAAVCGRIRGWSIPVVAAVVVACPLLPAGGQEAGKLTVEDVRKAWQKRQDRVKSVRMQWVERRTYAKGIVARQQLVANRMRQSLEKSKKGATPPYPAARDASFDVPCTLLVDGNQVYHSAETFCVSPLSGLPSMTPFACRYDKQAGTLLNPKGFPDASGSQAHVRPSKGFERLKSAPLLPPLMTFRPFVPALRLLNLDSLTATGQRALIANTPCAELLMNHAGNASTRVWVDPARDCIILRTLTSVGTTPAQKVDVRYRSDPGAGWVPEGWELVVQFGNEKMQEVYRVSNARCEVNVPIAANEFAIDFAPGTRVVDDIKRMEYITKPSGAKRVILNEEQWVSDERLLETEPGEALGRERPTRWTLWAAAAGAGVTLAMLAWWVRRRRNRHVVRAA